MIVTARMVLGSETASLLNKAMEINIGMMPSAIVRAIQKLPFNKNTKINARKRKRVDSATQRTVLVISVLFPCGCLLKVIEMDPWSGGLFFILFLIFERSVKVNKNYPTLENWPIDFSLSMEIWHDIQLQIVKITLLDNLMNEIIIRPASYALVLELADRHA
jgi:hypothetical protein